MKRTESQLSWVLRLVKSITENKIPREQDIFYLSMAFENLTEIIGKRFHKPMTVERMNNLTEIVGNIIAEMDKVASHNKSENQISESSVYPYTDSEADCIVVNMGEFELNRPYLYDGKIKKPEHFWQKSSLNKTIFKPYNGNENGVYIYPVGRIFKANEDREGKNEIVALLVDDSSKPENFEYIEKLQEIEEFKDLLFIYVPMEIMTVKEWSNLEKKPWDAPKSYTLGFQERHLKKGILVETPFVEYEHTLNTFLEYATAGEDKMEVYFSLYRVDPKSSLVKRIYQLAKRKKTKVFVYLESAATGSEDVNKKLAKDFKKAGIEVRTSFPQYKVHMKACLIKTRGIYYSHISTGNYNMKTVDKYTDYQFITTNPYIGKELNDAFDLIMKAKECSSIMHGSTFMDSSHVILSPFLMKDIIVGEILCAKESIRIKCNHVGDPVVKRALYEACSNGVDTKVIARTTCTISPFSGIDVRSNNGRLLEHGRLYIFDGNAYISSADLLTRNLEKRIELMLKIPKGVKLYTKLAKGEILSDYYDRCYEGCLWRL